MGIGFNSALEVSGERKKRAFATRLWAEQRRVGDERRLILV
jgi:hypothetical protein